MSGTPAIQVLPDAESEDFAPRLDLWFRPHAEVSAAADLPRLVGPGAPAHRLVVRRDLAPVSHAALYVHDLRLPGAVLRVGIIGAVATDPGERRAGHALRLVHALLDEARARGVDVVVLWAEKEGLYERAGFVRAGRETLWFAERDGFEPLRYAARVRPMRWRDRDAVVKLHREEAVRTTRTREEWEAWWRLPRTSWYVLDQRGSIEAYAVVGKGADLAHCVHEWAGAEAALPELIGGIFQHREERELAVMAAPWKATAVNAMAYLGARAATGALGMIAVPDRASFLRRTARVIDLPARLAEPEADAAEFVRAIFGDEEREARLPFYLMGLDAM